MALVKTDMVRQLTLKDADRMAQISINAIESYPAGRASDFVNRKASLIG
jgi:hypothetical protein